MVSIMQTATLAPAKGDSSRPVMLRQCDLKKVISHRIIARMLLLLLLLLHPMCIILRRRIEHVPFPLTARPDFQHAGQVATSIAVIRRTPNGG